MTGPGAEALSARLWGDSADLADAALRHAFVRGLADGSLPPARFAGYVAQDAFFLDSFARAYALALARSPDRDTVLALADLVAGVRDELALHEGYAAQWGVDMRAVTPMPATAAYVHFLLSTAATAGLDVVLAAMTPCMRLYAHLGQRLDAEGEVSGPYADWVRTYADPAFDALAGRLESLLDRHGTDGAALRAAYRTAMRLELDFFDAAWAADAGLPGGGGEPTMRR